MSRQRGEDMIVMNKGKDLRKYLKSGAYQRRSVLLETMNELESSQITCANCPGKCCTFVSNSMQMTALETLDLYLYLQEENLWNEELEERLKENIREFRLDQRPFTARGQLMRKTYTCPFFLFQKKGCPIPGENKPYGCLGFNPSSENEESGTSCSSSLELLKGREELVLEEEGQSQEIKEALQLAWEKESIPVALLDFHRAVLALSLHY